ncbi:MAG: acyl-CoA thioesterase [Nitrososphaeraceae archaeon]
MGDKVLDESKMRFQKSPDDSKAETTIVMLPSDANPKGNVFGGIILKHVDLIAGVVAKRHANQSNVVTASIDRMTFIKPIFIGNALILSARINYVKRSSVEIEVNIHSEDLDYNTRVHAGRAFVTMVAIDKYGKPMEVPQLILRTEEDKIRFKQGEERMKSRLKEAGKIT